MNPFEDPSGTSPRRRHFPLLVPLLTFLLFPALALAEGDPEVVLLADFELGDVSSWSAIVGGPVPVTPTAFRATEFVLKEPHLFAELLVVGCTDVTDVDVPVINFSSVNNSVADAIANDADGDGCLDFSAMFLFRTLNQSQNGELVDGRAGKCAPPASGTTCSVDTSRPKGRSGYINVAAGTCLDVLPGTTSGYSPAVVAAIGPCFVSDPIDVELEILDGLMVPFKDFQTSATFDALPATELSGGLARGFLREVDAANTLLPNEIPLIGGLPLSVLLPGGVGNCSTLDDRDVHETESGWWFYFNYEAERVPWTGL